MSCREDEFLERALAAEDTLQAVLDLHSDNGKGYCEGCYLTGSQRYYPCPTRCLIVGDQK